MRSASSTYAGSREEGMSFWVRIARLHLSDSDIPPNPNRVEVDSCVGRILLLMLEVERRECPNGKDAESCADYLTSEIFFFWDDFKTFDFILISRNVGTLLTLWGGGK